MNRTSLQDPVLTRQIAAALLSIHAGLVAWVGLINSPTLDEVAHLPAGINHWVSGQFHLYRVNPPLVRSLAAVPVLFADPQTNWTQSLPGPYSRPEFFIGADFIQANGMRSFWLFTLARWACIPLSLIGGWTCYRWATDLYGHRSGLLGLCLWCFSPNIIGNAAMITPDAGAAALGCLAGYAFWKWLDSPSRRRVVCAGLALGAAGLTKTTWILLFGLWPLLWLTWLLCGGIRGVPRPGLLRSNAVTSHAPGSAVVPDNRQHGESRKARDARVSTIRQLGQMIAIILLALYVINLGYGFEGSLTRLEDYPFVSKTLAGNGPLSVAGGNRFAGSPLGKLPIPLPGNYVRGIDVQKRDFEEGLWTYLAGVHRRQGFWYYYLYAAMVKVPLGTWLLGVMALTMTLRRARSSIAGIDELVLLAPALATLVLVSSQTGINRHFRYVLPALPFVLIWVSKVGARVEPGHLRTGACVLAATVYSVASSLSVYPHSLSYFNEAAGGPIGGPAHLLDSNIDWGQDLLNLKRWLDAHPEAEGIRLAYFGAVDPRVAGIDAPEAPRGPIGPDSTAAPDGALGPQPGWFAVSVNRLYGYRHYETDKPFYTYFRRFKPVAMAGYSIYIYHITCDEADRVRKQLGLSLLGR